MKVTDHAVIQQIKVADYIEDLVLYEFITSMQSKFV